ALKLFRSLNPSLPATMRISASIRDTSPNPIWWISPAPRFVVVLWRIRTAYRLGPSGSDHIPTSVRPCGAYSLRTYVANLRYAGRTELVMASMNDDRMRARSVSGTESGSDCIGAA